MLFSHFITLAIVLSSTLSLAQSYSECEFKFGNRTFLHSKAPRLPPVLYTFPGSGNTWVRLLIEFSTGILTGSVYDDKRLVKALFGEGNCSWYVSVIKAHPRNHRFEQLLDINASSPIKSSPSKYHCILQNVTRFERAILLIRNPYDAIWADYQLGFSHSHSGRISIASFNWQHWLRFSMHFKPTDYMFLKYEQLQNTATRRAELRRVVNFIGSEPNKRRSGEPFNSSVMVTDEQLECAFVLADNNSTHRNMAPSAEGREAAVMTKERAYTKPLVCCMWAMFGAIASKVGYTSYRNVDCEPDQRNCKEKLKLLFSAPANSRS